MNVRRSECGVSGSGSGGWLAASSAASAASTAGASSRLRTLEAESLPPVAVANKCPMVMDGASGMH